MTEWDKNRTAGSLKVNQFDDAVRDNNDALEDDIGQEHSFSTGGTAALQGQHSFPTGTGTARDAVGTNALSAPQRLWFVDDERTDEYVPYGFRDSDETWIPIAPPTDVARHDEANDWTAGQHGSVVTVSPGAGSTDTFDWDTADGNFFKATATNDTIINNPTSALGLADMGSWTIQITQDAGAGHVITFGSEFLPAFGGQPTVDAGSNAVSLIHVTKLSKTVPNLLYRVELTA